MKVSDHATQPPRHRRRDGILSNGLVVGVGLSACLCFYLAGQAASLSPDASDLSSAQAEPAAETPPQSIAENSESDDRAMEHLPLASEEHAGHFDVTIRKPEGPPRVHLGFAGRHGGELTASCSTCHATRQPNTHNRVEEDLNEFHGSLKMAHGNLSCLSCHNADDYDALKLADGTRVEFSNVMQLCGQCHGPQTRDYEHNVHGGMTGYWDLSRGARQKNNCVDCHHPHSPQFPMMQPTFKPKDRFLTEPSEASQ